MATKNFKDNINKKKETINLPHADPFLIAKAKICNATVVTMEAYKENSASIPNICEYFDIRWINLDSFMKEQDWVF